MDPIRRRARTRRKFLKMLFASPLITGSSMLAGPLAELLRAEAPKEEHFLGWLGILRQQTDSVISSPEQALDVVDFEAAAQEAFPPPSGGWLAIHVHDAATM